MQAFWDEQLHYLTLVLTGVGFAGDFDASSVSNYKFHYRAVTNQNRRQVGAMFSGWGPHLRSIHTDAKGKNWMVLDTGGIALVNPSLDYYTDETGSWNKTATLPLASTIQQNMASILSGKILYSYGVNVGRHWLMECYLNTENIASRACNAVTVSGSVLTLAANANYLGAAVSPTGLCLVWWNVVGDNGGGLLHYTYNSGEGWNGPYTVTLGGYADLAYMYASFKSPTEVAFAGQAYLGGIYAAAYVQLKLGNNAAVATPFRLAENGVRLQSAEIFLLIRSRLTFTC